MRVSILRAVFVLAVISLAGVPAPALADQIDGDWCYEGLHIEIVGPRITTPAGNQITGQYTRHGFDYVVPDGEDNAGGSVSMRQLSDDMVRVENSDASGAALGEAVIWRKCQVVS